MCALLIARGGLGGKVEMCERTGCECVPECVCCMGAQWCNKHVRTNLGRVCAHVLRQMFDMQGMRICPFSHRTHTLNMLHQHASAYKHLLQTFTSTHTVLYTSNPSLSHMTTIRLEALYECVCDFRIIGTN